MAQLVAHLHGMEGVRSSNLLSSTVFSRSEAGPELSGLASSALASVSARDRIVFGLTRFVEDRVSTRTQEISTAVKAANA